MKLPSFFQLATRFYSNVVSIGFLCLLRDGMNQAYG